MDIKLDVSDVGIKKIQSLITSKLYSNNSTWVVELISNALDAYKRAGKDPAVLFYLKDIKNNNEKGVPDGSYYIVSDDALGLSEEDFIDKICTIPKSDKGGSSVEIGSFGIGSLSVFAYAKQTYWETVKDGTKCLFRIWEDDIYGLQYELLYKEDSEYSYFKQGIRVFIPNQFGDIDTSRLRYVKGVFIKHSTSNRKNYYENDLFYYNEGQSKLTVCIDDIIYDLNNSYFEGSLQKPICLKFKKDELDIQPTREGLQYTAKTIENIEQKLVLAEQFIVDEWNKKFGDIEYNIFDYNEMEDDKHIMFDGLKLRLTKWFVLNKIIKYKFPFKSMIFGELKKYHFDRVFLGVKKVNYKTITVSNINDFVDNGDFNRMVLVDSSTEKVKRNDVINAFTQTGRKIFVRKKENLKLKDYIVILRLTYKNKSLWREYIKAYQHQLQVIIDKTPKFEKYILPKPEKVKKEYVPGQKRNKKLVLGDVQYLRLPLKSGSDYVVDKININLKDNNLYIYDTSLSEKLIFLFKHLKPKEKTNLFFIILKEKQLKEMEESHNLVNVENLFNGKHRYFYNLATWLIFKENDYNFNNIDNYSDYIKYLSTDIKEKYDKINSYYQYTSVNDSLKNDIINMAKELNFYDKEVMSIAEYLQSIDEHFYIIDYFKQRIENLNRNIKVYNSDKDKERLNKILEDMAELFKRNKVKMNWQNYVNKKQIENVESF